MTGLGLKRPLVVQQLATLQVTVGVSPLPLAPHIDKTRLITSFAVTNPTGGVPVFIGDAGVTILTGFQILVGSTIVFQIDQGGRQLYEIQSLGMDIASGLDCTKRQFEAIPFTVWDLGTIFFVSSAPQVISIALFPTMYL